MPPIEIEQLRSEINALRREVSEHTDLAELRHVIGCLKYELKKLKSNPEICNLRRDIKPVRIAAQNAERSASAAEITAVANQAELSSIQRDLLCVKEMLKDGESSHALVQGVCHAVRWMKYEMKKLKQQMNAQTCQESSNSVKTHSDESFSSCEETQKTQDEAAYEDLGAVRRDH
jgi:hypothetical protein